MAGTDSTIALTPTGSHYTAGKFPHLTGCKILTLPEMSLVQVRRLRSSDASLHNRF